VKPHLPAEHVAAEAFVFVQATLSAQVVPHELGVFSGVSQSAPFESQFPVPAGHAVQAPF
jgi:hypothetical protein